MSENSELKSFLFFTNVDLTIQQKASLVEHGQRNSVTVQIFDMEVLRNVLDSRDGLLYRQQYLGISADGNGGGDWTIPQSSKICSYEVPVRCPCSPDGDAIDPVFFEKFREQLNMLLAYAFGHTCMATKYDDFIFILSLEAGEWDTEPGFSPFLLSIHCHITAFVWAFQECWQHLILGNPEDVSPRMRSLPGKQQLDIRSQFGVFVPHRISRSGAAQISIEDVSSHRLPLTRTVTTSTLLRLLAVAQSSQVMLWDDVDACPDMAKVLSTLGQINDAGSFVWDHFQIDRDDPERWEFVGER